VAGCGRPALPPSKGTAVPPTHRGLLARIDALVALVADRHGLALLPDGRLAAAEARVAVRATGLAARRSRGPRIHRDATGGGGVAPGGGRGRRATASPRRPAGGDQPAPRLQPDRRDPPTGPTLAAWCHGVPWSGWSRRSAHRCASARRITVQRAGQRRSPIVPAHLHGHIGCPLQLLSRRPGWRRVPCWTVEHRPRRGGAAGPDRATRPRSPRPTTSA
jgi:hypothetical protein